MPELLSPDFLFKGSLGGSSRGWKAFGGYVLSVRTSLCDYRCEILACVAEASHAFAKVRFSGVHVGSFRGYTPTGKMVHWLGAALFTLRSGKISEVWVLGDLAGLDSVLRQNGTGPERLPFHHLPE